MRELKQGVVKGEKGRGQGWIEWREYRDARGIRGREEVQYNEKQ